LAVTAGLREAGPSAQKIRVANVRLDDFPFDRHDRLRLIKIDVEGAEVDVLKGAENLLRERHPVLLIEVHGFALPSFGSSVADLRAYLGALGYQEHRLPFVEANGDEYYQAVFKPISS
jgi:hypothetical protein